MNDKMAMGTLANENIHRNIDIAEAQLGERNTYSLLHA